MKYETLLWKISGQFWEIETKAEHWELFSDFSRIRFLRKYMLCFFKSKWSFIWVCGIWKEMAREVACPYIYPVVNPEQCLVRSWRGTMCRLHFYCLPYAHQGSLQQGGWRRGEAMFTGSECKLHHNWRGTKRNVHAGRRTTLVRRFLR